ncbi:MAG: DUF2461 domain-containing protein [Oscillospiraceae bacterium]|nr:DUF2461 domain-containing protein [Oscillospiraceae bacterium]
MFQGFCKDTSGFLWDLMFNNERSWFNEHKERYERVLNLPFRALAADTLELLKLRHPELQFSLHISRIYRDARRLFGRGPFKDHLWFSIGYTVEGWHAGPMFWFEIGASEYSYGVGFFDATPAQMEAFRRSIDANPARFERIAKKVEALGNFRVFGPEYKRPKGDLGETLNLWYNRKRVGVECCRDFGEELYEAQLPEKLASEFEKLMELYDYFLECYYAAPDGGK